MIIVTGTIVAPDEHRREIMRMCMEQSQRSRHSAGCMSHHVHVDLEDMHRVVFVEIWRDKTSVRRNFFMEESREFIRAVSGLAAEPPEIKLYDAETLTLEQLTT